MNNLEQLEEFRRYLQSTIAKREYLISLLIEDSEDMRLGRKEQHFLIAPYAYKQQIEKKILANIIEQKRAIHKYERDLEKYWKHMKEMEDN